MTPAPLPMEEDLPASGAWTVGDPVGDRRFHSIGANRRFQLEGGGSLPEVVVAYETWGKLAADASNAVLVCHALTGDSHAAGRMGEAHKTDGWWNDLIGPGKALDTDHLFVVCSNVLGGCQGTTGPASINPETGRPYGSTFPVVSIRDMVRVQASLADSLGIDTWRCVVGGSMGGMQALEWAVMYPDRVASLALASTTAEASALQIAWSHIGRTAIEADPRFNGGDYYGANPGEGPHRGLVIARMVAQVTYRSDEVFTERFHRTVIERFQFSLERTFDVEGYLDHHGLKLARRFDANSYLRLNRAMDLHDLGRGRGSTAAALSRVVVPSIVATVRSDGLYLPTQQRELHTRLLAAGGSSKWVDIDSPHGHDGFLLETAALAPHIRELICRAAEQDSADRKAAETASDTTASEKKL